MQISIVEEKESTTWLSFQQCNTSTYILVKAKLKYNSTGRMGKQEGYLDVLGMEDRIDSSFFIMGSQQMLLKQKNQDIANANMSFKDAVI